MKKCSKCDHDCHCDEINCYECVNDVCTECDCQEENINSDIPLSFTQENV